jgi:hypothetical protein
MDWTLYYKEYILSMPQTYNDKLENLPPDTKGIIFGREFNQPINEGILPENLITIIFGLKFNQPINEGSLPENLKYLTFGHMFNKSIDSLPNSLEYLCLGINFSQYVNKFPSKLIHLSFWSDCTIKNNIPLSVKNLAIYFSADKNNNEPIENLPHSIEEIVIQDKEYYSYLKKIPFGCKVIVQEE